MSTIENLNQAGMETAFNYVLGFVIGTNGHTNPKHAASVCAISNLAGHIFGFLIIGLAGVQKDSTKNKILLGTGTLAALIKVVALKRLDYIGVCTAALLMGVHFALNLCKIKHINKLLADNK